MPVVEEAVPRSLLLAEVELLQQVVQRLQERDPAELPGAVSLEQTAALLAESEKLQALVLTWLSDVEKRQLHALDGSLSTASWVRAQTTSLDSGDTALARRMASMPHVAKGVAEGWLSLASAGRVGKAVSALRPHVDRPDGLVDGQPGEEVVHAVVVDGVLDAVCEARGGLVDGDPLLVWLTASLAEIAGRPESQLSRLEAGFVVLARHVEATLLPSALARLVDAVLPLQLERRAAEGHRARGFTVERKDDGSGWRARGDLDLECGELLSVFLRAERDVDPDNPDDTRGWVQLRADGWQTGDDVPVSAEPAAGQTDGSASGGAGAAVREPRSRRQRDHDALRNGLRRYLDSGVAGLREKVAPHIVVTTDLQALNGVPGARPARTASGTTVPASLLRRWWCDSAVSRFVLSLGRRVLETSHTERTLKPHERRAKHLETGGRCQTAGCRCGPGERLYPHHADAWARTRTTSLATTVLLCGHSHHHVHTGRTVRLRDGRFLSEEGFVDGPGPWEDRQS